jgi:1-acyl-sn-glycerol-3-phosphate acyltransferase
VWVMEESKRCLAAGMSIMMFPEGTRSATGELGAFKDGAFQLAIDAGVPILPLAVAGTRACRPKGSLWFGNAKAIVKVLPPIESAGRDVASLREESRRVISAALPDLRVRAGETAVRRSVPAPAHKASEQLSASP